MSSLINIDNISKPSLSQSSRTFKKSRSSGSFRSVHGSKFGRSLKRTSVKNNIFNTNTTSTVNSRIIPTLFGSFSKSETFPTLGSTVPMEIIRELGNKLDIVDYEFNYVSFWLLDVFAKVLKEVQARKPTEKQQILFLSWLRFVLRSISVSGSSREEMFTFLQETFISAVSIIKDGKPIPSPEDVSIKTNNEVSQEISSQLSKMSSLLFTDTEVSSTKKRSRLLRSNSHTSRRSRISSGKSSKSSSQSETESLSSEDKITLNLNIFYTIVETIYQV